MFVSAMLHMKEDIVFCFTSLYVKDNYFYTKEVYMDLGLAVKKIERQIENDVFALGVLQHYEQTQEFPALSIAEKDIVDETAKRFSVKTNLVHNATLNVECFRSCELGLEEETCARFEAKSDDDIIFSKCELCVHDKPCRSVYLVPEMDKAAQAIYWLQEEADHLRLLNQLACELSWAEVVCYLDKNNSYCKVYCLDDEAPLCPVTEMERQMIESGLIKLHPISPHGIPNYLQFLDTDEFLKAVNTVEQFLLSKGIDFSSQYESPAPWHLSQSG